jgi:hypothetical protein
MLDRCISLCHKFPEELVCEVCRRKAGTAPKAKRTSNPRNETREARVPKAPHEARGFRQRYENRTWKFMKVRANPQQNVMRLPQALRDFMRAHIAR